MEREEIGDREEAAILSRVFTEATRELRNDSASRASLFLLYRNRQ